MTDILAVRDLEKTFGSVVAARDITVTVPAHQTVGIIGANGAGKTTFVNMITGHLKPSKGAILFEGNEITGLPSRSITRLGISRSFQVAQVFPTMTVLENMRIASAIAKGRAGIVGQMFQWLDSPETAAESDAALELFQIARYRDARAATTEPNVFSRSRTDRIAVMAPAPAAVACVRPASPIHPE